MTTERPPSDDCDVHLQNMDGDVGNNSATPSPTNTPIPDSQQIGNAISSPSTSRGNLSRTSNSTSSNSGPLGSSSRSSTPVGLRETIKRSRKYAVNKAISMQQSAQ